MIEQKMDSVPCISGKGNCLIICPLYNLAAEWDYAKRHGDIESLRNVTHELNGTLRAECIKQYGEIIPPACI